MLLAWGGVAVWGVRVVQAQQRAFVGVDGEGNLTLVPSEGTNVIIDGVVFQELVEDVRDLKALLRDTQAQLSHTQGQLNHTLARLNHTRVQLSSTLDLLRQSWRVLIEPEYGAFCEGPWEFIEGKGCRLHNPQGGHACASRFFSPGPVPYTTVRGSLTANQQGGARAFNQHDMINFFSGGRHLWTYAVGIGGNAKHFGLSDRLG